MDSAHSKKYINEKILNEFIGSFTLGSLTTAAIIGAASLMAKKKQLYCDKLNDSYSRNQCFLSVIDAYISNLKESRNECEKTPDPAQCHLNIINKIDKLLYKKEVISKRMEKELRFKIQKKDL